MDSSDLLGPCQWNFWMTPLGCAPVWHPPPWNSAKTGHKSTKSQKKYLYSITAFSGLTPQIPRVLFTDTSELIHFFTFLVFLFSTIYLLVLCGRLRWSVSAFECTLKQHLVSYRSIIRRRQISGALHTPSDSTEQQGHWGMLRQPPSCL